MPSLGADMEEGTVLEWLVGPGDEVHKGDIVAVVDTAKAAVEVETFVDGVVTELLVDVGAKVPVGTPLARIGDHAEAPHRPAGPATPLVRTLATELGVDLATLTGTGTRGRITRTDVQRAAAALSSRAEEPAGAPHEAAAPARAPTPRHRAEPGRRRVTPYARRLAHELGVDLAGLDVEGVIDADAVRHAATGTTPPPPTALPAAATPASRQDRMRETIGRLMARSKREIPHYYLSTTVDLARARDWMQARNRDLPVAERLVPAALLLKATALAARRHPQLNGFWVDDAFVPGTGVHLGVAISLRGGGLVAPAIHDADTLAVDELMAAVRDLVGRARTGRLRGTEMSDPTLTVTNLGDQGVEAVHGVIYPPQVALVGFGRVVERPWAVDGMLAVRPLVRLTLAADHRATDGFVGGRLLGTIDHLLQTPEEL